MCSISSCSSHPISPSLTHIHLHTQQWEQLLGRASRIWCAHSHCAVRAHISLSFAQLTHQWKQWEQLLGRASQILCAQSHRAVHTLHPHLSRTHQVRTASRSSITDFMCSISSWSSRPISCRKPTLRSCARGSTHTHKYFLFEWMYIFT